MEKWTELRTAHYVAKLGTVSGASAALGLHRATVNRHIDLLEEELGARIFIRHARGYTLTELGEDVLRVSQKTEELIEDLVGRVRGEKAAIEGDIKVTALPRFFSVLMEPIAEFRRRNPNCRVNAIASEQLEKLEYGDAHVALRIGQKPDHPDYVVTLARYVSINLYAQESYIRRKGMPSGSEDFQGHEFVLPFDQMSRFPFLEWIFGLIVPSQIAVSTVNQEVASGAISAGLGMGFLTDLDAQGRSDLKAVLPESDAWSVPIWLVTHVDLHRTEKVQEMLKCIKSGLKNTHH